MATNRECPECGGSMKVVNEYREVFHPNPDTMTDGQLAEQMAARMGGHFEEGVHGTTVQVYECDDCQTQLQVA